MHLSALSPASLTTTICCDVSSEKLNLICRGLSEPGRVAEWEIENGTEAITQTLTEIREVAASRGIERLCVVAEPTGRYHKLLLRIAVSLGFETALVDAGHVAKMRTVVFGDNGKTDVRDPYAIEAVAERGRLIIDRRLPEVFELLRQWGKLYHDAETELIAAKSRVHCALTLLFPDFDFSTDFLYSSSGHAIFRCYRFNPHAMAEVSVSRIHARLRKSSGILRSSVERLRAQARQTAAGAAASRVTDLLVHELELAWQDLELAAARRQNARVQLELLYDEARTVDSHLPDTDRGPLSKAALARFVGEASAG